MSVLQVDLIERQRSLQQSAPEHWSLLNGPANWFRLRHPPQWKAEERQGTYGLHPPDTDALIAINSIWMANELEAIPPKLTSIVHQFPSVRHVRHSLEPQLNCVRGCMQGEAQFDTTLTWWQKWLNLGRWRAWKMWGVQRGQLLIVVTLLHERERDPELESLVRLMLLCLELPEFPADPPDVFARRTLEIACGRFPLQKFRLLEGFELEIDSSRLNLSNFYRAYLRDPESFEQIMVPAITTAIQIQDWGAQGTSPSLEQVRDRIMPMLFSEEVWQERLADFAGQQWIAGLMTLYVVDESQTYWYVRNDLVAKWGLTLSELHEIAIDNLQNHFEQEPMEVTVATSETGLPSILMPRRPDTYNTTRLLCQDFLEKLRTAGEGDLVIGAPGRDFFVAVSTRFGETVKQVRQQVVTDFAQTDHPLTSRMLLVTADGVSEFIDDDGQ